MTRSRPSDLTFFTLLKAQLNNTIPVVRASKASLTHLFHSMEDILISERMSSMIFAGFQRSTYWQKETSRYRELNIIADLVCVFAVGDLPSEELDSELYIQMEDDDPLLQEWFLLIVTGQFGALLCGKDLDVDTSNEIMRQFDTIWLFDPAVIETALDNMEQAVAYYRPERLEMVRTVRQRFPSPQPNGFIITRLSLDFIRFEERLHQQLRWQTDLAETLITSITHSLYIAEIDAQNNVRLMYLSPNLTSLTGYSIEQLQTNWRFWVEHVLHPEDRIQTVEQFMQGYQQALVSCDSFVLQYRIYHHDGHIIWLRDSIRVKSDATDGSIRLYGVIEDITERLEAEQRHREQERLRLELEQQQQINAFKTFFMSSVSHEFRTPLSTVLSSSELLERYYERLTPADRIRKLRMIKSQVLHLRRMLDDITFVLNGEVHHLGFNPQPLRLKDYIGEIITHLRISDGLEHRIDYVYNGLDATMMIDPVLLKHIIVNLASNAFKYSSAGSTVHIHVTVTDSLFRLQIEDHGVGIPVQDYDSVYEMLHRGHNVTNIGGIGLGLNIARACTERHGGIIQFESTEGVGTIFYVQLPTALASTVS